MITPVVSLKTAASSFIAIALCIAWGCMSIADRTAPESFSERYHAYQAFSQAGYASINKKDYAAAIDQYTKAIALSPFVPSDHYYRGLAWYKTGNNENAIADFDAVILLDSRWAMAYVYRGLARVNRGDYAEALTDYTTALNLNGKDPVVHNDLAWLYATAKEEKVRDIKKALEHAKLAAELSHEQNAEILDTLARVYFLNGQIVEAIGAQEKALKLDPGNDSFKKALTSYQKSAAAPNGPGSIIGNRPTP
jgi:tetratricopeptide (TPR) repeat protein